MFTDNLIGEAELSLWSENSVTEGRHILPLTGATKTTYGSITVEVTTVTLHSASPLSYRSTIYARRLVFLVISTFIIIIIIIIET